MIEYNNELQRLYKPNSIIFITIVTSKRRDILIENIEILKFSIANTHKHYNFNIQVEKGCFGAVCVTDSVITSAPENSNTKPLFTK